MVHHECPVGATEVSYLHWVAWARRIRRDGSVGAKVRLMDRAFYYQAAAPPTGRIRVVLGKDDPQTYWPMLMLGR
jgi:hypothetical protein